MHPPALLSVSRMASHSGSRTWDIYFSALKSECLQLQSKCAHFSRSVDTGERAIDCTAVDVTPQAAFTTTLDASRLQPRDRGLRYVVGSRYIGLCFALREPLQGFRALVQCVVTRLDRLARSTPDLLNILDDIAKRGGGFKIVITVRQHCNLHCLTILSSTTQVSTPITETAVYVMS
jgi:hypothetical protein